MFYSFGTIAMIVFALFYYRAGVFDGGPALLWGTLSVGVSLLTLLGLKWGLIGLILGQIALFIGITVFRVIRQELREKK